MPSRLAELPRWLFSSDPDCAPRSPGGLLPRWIFLRALGLIFFSAFYSLLFQARGLIGPDGLLPAGEYLQAVRASFGFWRFWYAPSLLWISSGSRSVAALCWIGIVASALLLLNLWPRLAAVVCLIVFLSFISTLQQFSSYQSDGMLLCAGFLGIFFAPPGFRPGLGRSHPPSRASLYLLLLEWFTIYFESGVAKMLGGDPEWRHLTAMDEYYQNGPLPTWIGWYAQHLPHWFHVGTAGFTLLLELGLIWLMFFPRPFRIALFWLVTPMQIGIILTSNYAFLNYLVLFLGVLILDDKFLGHFLPRPWRIRAQISAPPFSSAEPSVPQTSPLRRSWAAARLILAGFFLTWIFYGIVAQLAWMVIPRLPLPQQPVAALEPFRVANSYGLFAVMTRGRYEIEFQGSNDGQNWTPYPFCYKPQDPRKAPGIFAPYQPRFDWNLWFASLDNWQNNRFVVYAEERLLMGSPAVLSLFAGNPFAAAPPQRIRAVVWQYWFTDPAEKRQGFWWRRQFLGLYAPELALAPNGKFAILALPNASGPVRQ